MPFCTLFVLLMVHIKYIIIYMLSLYIIIYYLPKYLLGICIILGVGYMCDNISEAVEQAKQ